MLSLRHAASVAAVFLIISTGAVDIHVDKWSCDDSLPIQIEDFSLYCGTTDSGQKRNCTLGQDAIVTAQMAYSGVYDSISNNTAYVSVDLIKMGVTHTIFDAHQVNVCDKSYVTTTNTYCPRDGSYNYYNKEYTIPSSGSTDWFSTGWGTFTAEVYVHADAAESTPLLDCTVTFTPMVTAKSSSGVSPPAAATFFGITALVVGSVLAVFAIMHWCHPAPEKENNFELMPDPRRKTGAFA